MAENATYPAREGYPVGAIFAYRTAGIDADGYPLFRANDGTVQTAEEFFQLNRFGASTLTAEQQRALYTYIGTDEPKVSGGFINNFEYKDWQLSVNFMFNLGMKVRVQPNYSPTYFDRGLNTNHEILNRFGANGNNGANGTNGNVQAAPSTQQLSAAYPALLTSTPERAAAYTHFSEYQTYSMLDVWVRNRNYCRLQSVRLGYRIPKKVLQPIGITSASVSLEGRNLLVFGSSYRNYLDPETMGNPFAQPVPKSFIFGVNVNF